jgi:superfamily II DNA or RNA helicase
MKINNQEDRLINIFFGMPEKSLSAVTITPTIKIVPTRYMYNGPLDKNKDFSIMMADICRNSARNNLIINTVYESIQKTETKKALVLTKSIEQAEVIKAALIEKGITTHLII